MDARQMEMEQLQAQVDVMLEEVNDLQNYRICAEKGKVFKPEQTTRADTDGCVLPTTLPPPQTDAAEKPAIKPEQKQNKAAADKPVAPTAKTFRLPSSNAVDRDVPLNRFNNAAPAENAKGADGATATFDMPQTASEPESAGNNGGDNFLGDIQADYPNERVRRLIEAAVDQALGGRKQGNGSLADVNQTESGEQQRVQQPQQPEAPAKPQGAGGENYQQAHKEAVQNLVPSCREGEFLTTAGGKVVCQRAASAGKMACPPRTLRVYLDRLSRHLHYFVSYTPHGQEQSATEANHKITVQCNNGNYKLQTVTRMECGGRPCHPNRKPAYTKTYVCNKDNTGRCYAEENGRLVNHSFTEATITEQY